MGSLASGALQKAGIDNDLSPGELGARHAILRLDGCDFLSYRYDTHLVGAMVWEKEIGLSHPAQKQCSGCNADYGFCSVFLSRSSELKTSAEPACCDCSRLSSHKSPSLVTFTQQKGIGKLGMYL